MQQNKSFLSIIFNRNIIEKIQTDPPILEENLNSTCLEKR